jgi:hypothetical protein
MNDYLKNMSCEEFQEQLAELIGSGANASAHPHLQNCDLCRAFFADLEAIAAAARELFPVEDPSDRVWEQIRSAIQEEEEGKTSAK